MATARLKRDSVIKKMVTPHGTFYKDRSTIVSEDFLPYSELTLETPAKQEPKEEEVVLEVESEKEPMTINDKLVNRVPFEKGELQKLEFSDLKEIANKFGETGRSKRGLIRDILKAQDRV